ncbi:alpha/beta-hydrolase [Saitoella complicata NRRL Y-17804]|nr:alpha/beta-hydrolase [Saitoella complicata NRRL Y-17804]ODQ55053.1 alpha/beta-hydrolase [Saitoella complicata NRRL Y-17804]
MGSPKAIGKYAVAVQMSNLAGSNYATTYSLYNTTEESYGTVVVPILEETGCANVTDQVACLKAYDATELVNLEDVARYVLVDGAYITQRELPLDGSAPVADVHFMMGFMRDDGAAFIGYPTSTNETAALEAQSLPVVPGNSLFAIPSGPNATLDVFNVTARVTTDIEFRCLDQATAYAGVVHDLFQDVWFYEFNRSYQTPGFDPNYPVCEAPITEDFPYGDPNQEYFKCHSGELYYVFGNLPTNRPPRDQHDIPFEQEMVDIWTSFARTYNPNPDPNYLTARRYTSTKEELKAEGAWTPVTKRSLAQGGMPVRELMRPSYQTGWGDMEQCASLGYPIDYYA